MRVLLIFFAIALLAVASATTAFASTAAVAPRFTVDLDKAPIDRWTDAATAMLPGIKAVLDAFDNIIPLPVQNMLAPLIAKLLPVFGETYGQEMQSVANVAGVNVGKLILVNLIYDITACTSIVTEGTDSAGRKTMYHARNLDYDIPHLRNVTATIDFKQGNTTVYSCPTFVGYIGCLSGVRKGGFSVTVDEWDQEGPAKSFIDNVLSMLQGGKSIGMFLRTQLATKTTFAEALEAITTTRLAAPVFIIMAGANPGDGAIVSRNRAAPANVWNFTDVQQEGKNWFLETNYPHWQPAPAHDDRRDPANKLMGELGPAGVNDTSLFGVLSTPPIMNQGTKYTAIMHPATGEVKTYVRWDADSVDAKFNQKSAFAWVQEF